MIQLLGVALATAMITGQAQEQVDPQPKPPIPAKASEAEKAIKWTFNADFYSRYVWRGAPLNTKAVFQPSITAEGQGWGATIWGNVDLTDENLYYGADGQGRITEWDSTAWYSKATESGTWTLGVTHYDFPNTGFASTTELWGQWAFGGEWNPYIAAFFDVDEVDGTYVRFGAGKSQATGQGTLSYGAYAAWSTKKMNNFLYGNNEAGLSDFGINLTYAFPFAGGEWKFYGNYSTLLNADHRRGQSDRGNFAFGAGWGFKF